jgi:hypothetical protein
MAVKRKPKKNLAELKRKRALDEIATPQPPNKMTEAVPVREDGLDPDEVDLIVSIVEEIDEGQWDDYYDQLVSLYHAVTTRVEYLDEMYNQAQQPQTQPGAFNHKAAFPPPPNYTNPNAGSITRYNAIGLHVRVVTPGRRSKWSGVTGIVVKANPKKAKVKYGVHPITGQDQIVTVPYPLLEPV